jgi:aryl-alcohol dehydrogenase-like predicted oxidoreductase
VITRRRLLETAGAALFGAFAPTRLVAGERQLVTRKIPSSGEALAIVGMGTSGTFTDGVPKDQLRQVLQAFFDHGGQLIDTSPMYAPAERLLGELLPLVRNKDKLFAASKVWTTGRKAGIAQMDKSFELIGVKVMDLMQVHNLVDWRTQLATLRDWKRQGRIRYLGVTTSHGRNHRELMQVMRSELLDFVQFSYNIADREAERTLFPLARDKGIATLINRPFRRAGLFGAVKGKPLPDWAAEFDCTSWGQFFLKFIAGHPDVTCIIPATSNPGHVVDNQSAGYGRLPDAAMRERMARYFASL